MTANLAYKQSLLRAGLPITTEWHDAKTASASVIKSMTKLLRCLSFNNYIVDHDSMANSRIAEKVLKYNLTADDREVDYLVALLDIPMPSAASTGIPHIHTDIETDTCMVYNARVEQLLTAYDKDRVFTLQSIPTNYLDIQTATFYERCSMCKKYGLLSICLLCGEMMCSRKCEKPKKEEDVSNLR